MNFNDKVNTASYSSNITYLNLGAKQIKVWKSDDITITETDWIAEEVPVSLIYNGISHAVLMTSPNDLEIFAFGFSISEGIITHPNDILSIDVFFKDNGIEVHIQISNRCFMALKRIRRIMEGRTGCGLCGVESLNQIHKTLNALPFSQRLNLKNLDGGLEKMRDYQQIGNLTGCTHVAVWMCHKGLILAGYEDIARHVALDKILGCCIKRAWKQGAILISSRASYEIVQKSIICGIEILFAMSAATYMAVNLAKMYNLTLVGFSKPGRSVIYTHPQRLI